MRVRVTRGEAPRLPRVEPRHRSEPETVEAIERMCPSPDPSKGGTCCCRTWQATAGCFWSCIGFRVRRVACRDPTGAFPTGQGGGADPRLGKREGGRVRVAVAQARRGA